MGESISETLPIRRVLRTCQKEVTETGDVLYTSSVYGSGFQEEGVELPFQAVISTKGVHLLEQSEHLFDLVDLPFEQPMDKEIFRGRGSCYVTKEWIKDGNKNTFSAVALKRISPHHLVINGVEQFRAMRALEDIGVLCGAPLIATNTRFVARWVWQDQTPSLDNLEDYLADLKEAEDVLRELGVWPDSVMIDRWGSRNFRINNLDSDNLFDQYIAMDPVIRRAKIAFYDE